MREALVGAAVALLLVTGVVVTGRTPRPAEQDPAPVPPGEVYDPVRAGEELPSGYRKIFPRDAIPPIYRPEFVSAQAARWPDDTLVIGVAGDGEAKAYPVSILNRREIVNDRLARTPILVTW